MRLRLLAVATLVLLAGCAGRTAMEAGAPGLAEGFRLKEEEFGERVP